MIPTFEVGPTKKSVSGRWWMGKRSSFISFVLFVLFLTRLDAAPSVSPMQFTQWYRTHLSAELQIPSMV